MARAEHATNSRAHKSYTKRISDHVAIALVVYTLMLIFVTSPTMESNGTSILPYFMLVVFVAMVIPACRNMEHRWQELEAGELSEASLETRFGVDRVKLWAGAILIPIILSVLFTVF
jgi:cell division protein FtsW (lipid II flippase)